MKTKHLFSNLVIALAVMLQLFAPTAAFAAPVTETGGPTVTLSTSYPNPGSSTNFTMLVYFSELVTGFEETDIVITNGTLRASSFTYLSGDPHYEFIVDAGISNGEITIDIAADIAIGDVSGLGNQAAEQFIMTMDRTQPTVVISTSASDPTITSPIPFTFTFSEDMTGFDITDITVGNGSAGNFQTTSASVYTADITPTADGSVTVDVASAVATDLAGNNNYSATQYAIEYDGTPPTITISSTESDPTNTSPFTATFTFSENVTGFDVTDITVGNGAAGNFQTTSASVYTADITPTSDGSVTVDVAADVAADGAGNVNTVADQYSLSYDGTNPTAEITSSEPDPTNNSPFEVTVTFSEDVSGFEVTDLQITNGTASNFLASSASVYTADITPTLDGEVWIDMTLDVAFDAAGNGNDDVPWYTTVNYDGTAPTLLITSAESDPTSSTPIAVTFTFSEDVTGFDVTDITVGNGTAGNFQTTSAWVYTADITPTVEGAVTVDVAAAAAQDAATNDSLSAVQFSITYADATAPSLSISSAESDPTSASPFSVTFTFSEAVTGFDVSDITVGNGAASNFQTTSSSVYTADITPTTDGSVTVDVAADIAVDGSSNGNTVADQFSITYDGTIPTVAITSTSSDPTTTSPIPVTITFSEEVTGFEVTDITVGNGTASNFATVSASVYTADITPTADGTVTVDVAADVASDPAGNMNDAAIQYSVAYDGTRPTVIVWSLESTPTNTSPITFTIDFSEDVTGLSAEDFTLVNAVADTLSGTGASYTLTATPSADGFVSITLGDEQCSDAAGNLCEASIQYTIEYDSTSPGVAITSAESDPTSNASFEVTFTFDEDVTGFDVTDITVGNGSASNFATVSASVYTADITPSSTGSVTVDVAADVASDAAGNLNTAAVQFSISFEPPAPIASLIMGLGETASNISPLVIGASFSEVVTGFEITDLVITNGTASNFTGSGDAYEFDVTPDAEGVVTIQIPAGVAENASFVGNLAASLDIDYDITSPGVAITSIASDPAGSSPIPVTITFDEDVTGFEVTDITVGNGSAGNLVAVSDAIYTVDITPTADGTVTVDVAADVASDLAGNYNTAAIQFSIDYLNTEVTVVISSTASDPTGISPIPVTITFSEDVTGFDVTDLTVGNGSAGNFSATSGSVYTADVTPTANGEVTVDIAADVAQSGSLVGNNAAVQFSITYNGTDLTVAITSAESSPTNADPFAITVTFSEDVTGFDISDLTVGNGTASNFIATNGSVYTADINPTADGSVTVDIAADVAQNGSSLGNLAASQFSLTYDGTRPTVVVSSIQSSPTNDSPITITIEFSEDITGLSALDLSATNATIGALSGSGSSYTLSVTPTTSGFVTVSLGDEQCSDAAGNLCEASIPYTIEYDSSRPGVTITSPSAGNLTFTFSEDVTGFAIGDISATGATLSNFSGSGAIYTAQYTATGASISVSIPADVAMDEAGNTNTASNAFTLAADTTAPSLVSITRLDANPTTAASVRFSVTFSEPIDGLDNGDLAVAQSGVTGASLLSISGSGSVYTVSVSTGTGTGTLELRLSTANNIQDLAGNDLAAVTVTSEAYTIDHTPVGLTTTTLQMSIIDPTATLSVQFNEDVYNPAGNTDTDDVTNPNNFLLLKTGSDGVYNTTTCAAGVSTQDVRITVNSVSYNNTSFTATLNVNNGVPLSPGGYRLMVCGTTSITDLAGNSLNGGNDVIIDLVVWDRNNYTQPLPVTGIAPATTAPANNDPAAYIPLDSTLTINAIGLNAEIMKVQFKKNDWDITWLGDKLGLLVGGADMERNVNHVITGHNWDYGDVPGPFLNLPDVAVGDVITVKNAEGIFTFTVTENKVVDQYDLDEAFIDVDEPTLTLVTCDGYEPYSRTFTQRRIVRAVMK